MMLQLWESNIRATSAKRTRAWATCGSPTSRSLASKSLTTSKVAKPTALSKNSCEHDF